MRLSFQHIFFFSATFAFSLLGHQVYAQAASGGTAYDMTIGGVKVIVQPSGNEIVEIQTILKGGVENYPASKAGIESLAMSALTECGTANDSKNSFKNKLDKVSAQMSGNSGKDYATFTLNCIKGDLDGIWPLYVDAFTTPLFDAKEFARIKQDAIDNLRSQASQPDYAINKMAMETAFAGKDYAKSPEGTEATVSPLTPEATKAYYQTILTRSRMVIVIVGDLDKDDITRKVNQLLAPIPQGAPFTPKKESYAPGKNSFASQKKDLATNYITAVTGGPTPGSPDFNAFTLAMRIFYDRTFLEIRTKNGLSYAPYSYFSGGLTAFSGVGVSTTEPDKYIGVMMKLIDKTKKEGFTAEEVKNMKTTYLSYFYYRQETNGAQASSLASNEVLHNNWRRALTFNSDIKNVTVEDVNKAFDKYVSKFTWVYQGNPTQVDPALYTHNPAPVKLPPTTIQGSKN